MHGGRTGVRGGEGDGGEGDGMHGGRTGVRGGK